VFLRLSKLAVAATLAFSLGLHWGCLQSVAWVGMIVSYSQDAPLTEALAKTFDGKHPCRLCRQIAKGRQSEKKSASAPAGKKFEFSYLATAFVFTAPADFRELCWPEPSGTSLSQAPPVPPPRQLPG
jgi:hypothetical protein